MTTPTPSTDSPAVCARCGAAHLPLTTRGAARCQKHRKENPITGQPFRQCGNPAVPGRDACRHHGGNAARGIANPQTQLRTYRGADLPTQLASRFLRALDDPELGSLRQEMAMVDARITQLVEKLPTTESAAAWSAVDGAHRAIARSLDDARAATTDDARAAAHTAVSTGLAMLADAIALAASERSLWGEIVDHFEVRRRLVDTDRRREESLGVALTLRQGMTLVGALLTAIADEVADAPTKLRLARRIHTLLVASGAVADGSAASHVTVASDVVDAEIEESAT